MAHPVGFEFLRGLFGELAVWPDCEIWFSARPVFWASEFTAILREMKAYKIIEVRYIGHQQSERWVGFSFGIYPVQSELKSSAREALSIAWDPIRSFLSSPRNPRARCTACFDPVSKLCTVENQ